MPDRAWWYTEWDRSEYDRARYEAAKSKLIELLGGKCTKCGSTENLQFDHVSRELKKFTITSHWNRSQAELQEELAKCQLLCQSCHLEKTKSELGVPHGGGKGGKHGCKCDPCRLKRNEYMRDLKRRKRREKLNIRVGAGRD
jgi:hypothetical protein